MGDARAQAEAPRPLPYLSAETIFHTMYLLDSYKRTTGRTLMSGLTLQDAPKALYEVISSSALPGQFVFMVQTCLTDCSG